MIEKQIGKNEAGLVALKQSVIGFSQSIKFKEAHRPDFILISGQGIVYLDTTSAAMEGVEGAESPDLVQAFEAFLNQ